MSTGNPGPWPSVAFASTVATVGVLPVFMVGGLAVQLSSDLEFSVQRLGFAVAAYFGSSSLASAPLGRLSQRLGYVPSLRIAALSSGAALAGMAFAPSLLVLAAWLVVAGVANGLGQPAANGLLVVTVPQGRRALAFAIKQSAIPLATLLGGLAVPTVALTVGWRWAFAAGALVAFVAAIRGHTTGSTESGTAPKTVPKFNIRPLLVLGGSLAFGAAAANSLGSFATASAVNIGISEAAAGWVQVGGSATGLLARLFVGWLTDRGIGSDFGIVLVMLLGGAAGFALLGTDSALLFTVGIAIGYGMGWAWPGLFNYAVSHRYEAQAAAATGITQTGVYVGGVFGPLLFGFLADEVSYQAAWMMAAASALIAAAGMQVGRFLVARDERG